jgi:hypothetical protein
MSEAQQTASAFYVSRETFLAGGAEAEIQSIINSSI